ncbi:hypothetical protein HELRODRAFT_184067 [Helobdella robusta]|uniref:Uncharacterized protein n=1 Tax=Helobdella robusta TaxID=6412 RepID=T1FKI7_HELRO|nr:hypothetical protein HELRODRAFT_184067 [Helobdella robusta]ESO08292.1 hypothetical protein HELRODRAFT_184067 [Helobdella robusta]
MPDLIWRRSRICISISIEVFTEPPGKTSVPCRLSISDGTILQLHSKNAQEFASVSVLKFLQNLPERPQYHADCRSVMGPFFNCTASQTLDAGICGGVHYGVSLLECPRICISISIEVFTEPPGKTSVPYRLSISDGTILQLHSKNAQEFASVSVLKFLQNLPERLQYHADCRSVMGPFFNCTASQTLDAGTCGGGCLRICISISIEFFTEPPGKTSVRCICGGVHYGMMDPDSLDDEQSRRKYQWTFNGTKWRIKTTWRRKDGKLSKMRPGDCSTREGFWIWIMRPGDCSTSEGFGINLKQKQQQQHQAQQQRKKQDRRQPHRNQ